MLTFLLLFVSALALTSSIFGAVFGSAQMIYLVCSIIIFGSIAIAIFTKNNGAWLGMFLSILIMVSVEQLATYERPLSFLVAIALAGFVTVYIKRPIWAFVKKDQKRSTPKLKTWVHLALKWG